MATPREIHGISIDGVEKVQQAIADYVNSITNIVANNNLQELSQNYAAGSETQNAIKNLNNALKEHIYSYTNYLLGYREVMTNVKAQYQKIDENTDSLTAGINAFNGNHKS